MKVAAGDYGTTGEAETLDRDFYQAFCEISKSSQYEEREQTRAIAIRGFSHYSIRRITRSAKNGVS